MRQRLGVSERHTCRVLGQSRTTQRRIRKVRSDEAALLGDVMRLASRFGRYGYRQITNLLRIEGWHVNHKRVERIWRQEGLKVPKRQPKRGRLWLNDGSCIRLRPLHKNHVWSYDFVSTRNARRARPETSDGARRVHEAVSGDQGGAEDPSARRTRGSGRSLHSVRSAPSIYVRTTGQSSRHI